MLEEGFLNNQNNKSRKTESNNVVVRCTSSGVLLVPDIINVMVRSSCVPLLMKLPFLIIFPVAIQLFIYFSLSPSVENIIILVVSWAKY